MFNLLTGTPTTHADTTDPAALETPWTPEQHLTVMRRLLDHASQNLTVTPADTLIAAARVHAEAAKTAGRTPTPVRTGPARTLKHDHDSI